MNAFGALADHTRREIVKLVALKGELSATDICKNFSISQPAVSQHLKVLREAKVLCMKKHAQKRLYSVDKTGVHEIDDWLNDLRKIWEKRLDSLDEYLQTLKKEKSDE